MGVVITWVMTIVTESMLHELALRPENEQLCSRATV